ncbi:MULTISPECIES: ExeM/NucH family extracellular endonuclease [unclassified Microcella]|uniref:ExeM/NucH family extracellular endonuclease n=1 Tax=unclassified Microcella TaxID=2630066 RepID=UPI0006FEE690|nr:MULTISPECIES: ExeM/NucH family extracellular endonuclease [unclassified Microcella]KQV25779.1 multifunctional nuclease/2',3'-cyclic-nucleotide 2'-phosphodiesterase/5'-nucleotidase/3'-nucleotidase [Yonghaparkia sp. Root332]KRF33412.1 multifunctional nuclease/2',3'-cyclic-nucleotide 2'-phosphodiesterase/5'-nucleotidase/3'-nucleotidase [Yonghaparkia sp. Soil809]
MSSTSQGGRVRATARATAFTTAVCVGLGLAGITATPAMASTHIPIADVQGPGASTPLVNQSVTVQGVVVADHRGAGGYSGFYIQTPGEDTTPGVSDGLFVFTGSQAHAVAIGDLVEVTGVASEYFGQTQVSATTAGQVTLVEAAVGVPAPVALPTDVTGAEREAFEDMLVAPSGDYLVSSSHELFRFGALWLSPAELAVKSTELVDAGPEADAIAAANRASRILLDDGFNAQVTSSTHPGDQPYFRKDAVVRNGDRVVFPTAGMVLTYGFDQWRLQPQRPTSTETAAQSGVTFETRNPRPAAAPEVGGDIRVAAYNVLNYFTTLTTQNSEARGARTAEQLAIQESKIVAAINGLDADVVALQEIENSVALGEPTDEALQALVAALNAQAGAGTWDYVRTPVALTDASIVDVISNAIIFKPAAVTPVGDSFTQIDETVWDIAREPIGQTFASGGIEFTVIANHFKSKGGSGTEPADGQGFFTAERVEQANALAALVETLPGEAGENVLLMGDFNSYSEEDPIQALTDAGWSDLVADLTDDQYTYTFDGELGSLDHAIASPGIAEQVTGVGVWSINSAEWSDRQYAFGATEAGTVFRSSDHDPVVVGLSTTPPPVEIDILTINDLHGRLEAAPPAAGAAVLGGLVAATRAANPNTLFISAGDSIGASTFTSFIQNDEPTLDALNAMGLDLSALGNHEFDQGRADVDERVIPNSDFPYLGANIYEKGTQTPAYQEYEVVEVDGVKVGFVGVLTESMPSLVSPDGISTLDFGDMTAAAVRVSDQLQDGDAANGEADVVILIVHEGAPTTTLEAATGDSEFGDLINGVVGKVDAVVSGHTHLQYDLEVPVPGTDEVMPLIQGGQYGEAYGHLELSVDPESNELLSITAGVKPLVGAAQPDPEIAAIVADAVAFAAVAGNESLGAITDDFLRGVDFTGQNGAQNENRGAESTLGNEVADAQLWATQDLGTEVALMNPGGLRANLLYAASGELDPAGNLTFREAANVQPFANTLFTMTLSGAQLRAVLEEQWQPAGSSRPFLKLGVSSTLEYDYDPTKPAGERIGTMLLGGAPVTADQQIRVVANSFLAAGGDNFFTLAQGTDRADSGRIDLQAFVDYVGANTPISPDFAQRSVGVSISAPDADGYTAGDQVTLALSSLLFTNQGDREADVVVSLGEEILGSAPIDATIVGRSDETGRATVTFTVPEGVTGAQQLTIAVPDNGTEASVAFEIAETLGAIDVIETAKVIGPVVIGKEARAKAPVLSVEGAELAYQWLRDGEPIEGATGATYLVTAADAGARIAVVVTANAPGYESASSESAERKVAGKPARLPRAA